MVYVYIKQTWLNIVYNSVLICLSFSHKFVFLAEMHCIILFPPTSFLIGFMN